MVRCGWPPIFVLFCGHRHSGCDGWDLIFPFSHRPGVHKFCSFGLPLKNTARSCGQHAFLLTVLAASIENYGFWPPIPFCVPGAFLPLAAQGFGAAGNTESNGFFELRKRFLQGGSGRPAHLFSRGAQLFGEAGGAVGIPAHLEKGMQKAGLVHLRGTW